MKITNIKKMTSGKYKICFDNGEKLNLNDEVILKNNLLFHKEIDEKEFNNLNNENEKYNRYSKVLKQIGYKMRSKKEIIDYMNKNEYSEKEKKEILKKLEDNHLINDLMYVKAFINDKVNLTNDGPDKIKRDLINQDIDENIINKELNNLDQNLFSEKLNKLIDKKISTNHKYSEYQLKQKLLEYFNNLGYPRDMIIDYLQNINVSNDSIIEKEYNSLLRKLSKKYEGDNLYFEIKNRLLRKGFSNSEINRVIKKSE
jgi:regulatory protein